jgi:hypothetical protein
LRFNPYRGLPREPRDIASDPAGLLMLDPDEPVRSMAFAAHSVPKASTKGADARIVELEEQIAALDLFRRSALEILARAAPAPGVARKCALCGRENGHEIGCPNDPAGP